MNVLLKEFILLAFKLNLFKKKELQPIFYVLMLEHLKAILNVKYSFVCLIEKCQIQSDIFAQPAEYMGDIQNYQI